MFFFVNQYLLSNDSSIEHAEMKRLKLFKDHNAEAKLVTRNYDQIIHATLQRFGLTDDQLVNMYDFFAGTTDYVGHDLHVSDLNLPIEYQVGTGNNYQEVKDGDRLVCIVYFTGGTVGLVNHIDWFDVAGNVTLRQQYDLRGFKSVDQFIGEDGQISFERYYRPDQTIYMERYYVKSVQNTPINSLNVLKNYQGHDRFFDSEEDLFAFFLDEVNKANGENNDKFAIDRMLPEIEKGDYLVIHDTGAHGYAMGYNYNGKLKSAELLLKEDGAVELIRRAETPQDYFATFDCFDLFDHYSC